MNELIEKLLGLVPGDFISTMPTEAEFSCKSMISFAEKTARDVQSRDTCAVKRALLNTQAVLDVTWEQLNTGHWSSVPLHLRHLYTAASYIKIILTLKQQPPSDDEQTKCDTLTAALKAADMGLLLGAPLPPPAESCLSTTATMISTALTRLARTEDPDEFDDGEHESDEPELRDRIRGEAIRRVQRPSLETFRKENFERQVPAILTDCMGHWPAMERWRRPSYLRRVAGGRTVPVELGARYTDVEWRQRLMSLDEFIDRHVLGRDPEVGYLAQHRLFDQVPALRSDIREPEYCCVSATDSEDGDTEVNAWFGPAGTVSPLHFDPKNNLLAQVVGRKRVYLFPPSDAALLRPHDDRLLFNTARFDPERPDLAAVDHRTPKPAETRDLSPELGRKSRRVGDEANAASRAQLPERAPSQEPHPKPERVDIDIDINGRLPASLRALPDAGYGESRLAHDDGSVGSDCEGSEDRFDGEGTRGLHALECVLAPGEMLYVPVGWWHHVRSLTPSFSVSFWWS